MSAGGAMNGIPGMEATWWGGGPATIRCMYWCTPAGNTTGAAAAAIPPPIHIICVRRDNANVTRRSMSRSWVAGVWFWGDEEGRKEAEAHLQLELQRLEVLDRLVQHRRLVGLKNPTKEFMQEKKMR